MRLCTAYDKYETVLGQILLGQVFLRRRLDRRRLACTSHSAKASSTVPRDRLNNSATNGKKTTAYNKHDPPRHRLTFSPS
eukprot:41763-Amphidinium_carterae.1